MIKLHVPLLNEGTDVWALVRAEHVGGDTYRLLDTEIEREQDCELQFKPGGVVIASARTGADGKKMLCAVRLQELP